MLFSVCPLILSIPYVAVNWGKNGFLTRDQGKEKSHDDKELQWTWTLYDGWGRLA